MEGVLYQSYLELGFFTWYKISLQSVLTSLLITVLPGEQLGSKSCCEYLVACCKSAGGRAVIGHWSLHIFDLFSSWCILTYFVCETDTRETVWCIMAWGAAVPENPNSYYY